MNGWPKWLIYSIVALVAILWAASVIINMEDRSYPIPGQLQIAFSAVLTALLGNQYFAKLREKQKKDEERRNRRGNDGGCKRRGG